MCLNLSKGVAHVLLFLPLNSYILSIIISYHVASECKFDPVVVNQLWRIACKYSIANIQCID